MKGLGVLLLAVALTGMRYQSVPESKSRERAFHYLTIHVGNAISSGDRSQFLGIYRTFHPDDSQRGAYECNLVFAASIAEDPFFIDFIVASGADINCRNKFGQSCIASVVERLEDDEGFERIQHRQS